MSKFEYDCIVKRNLRRVGLPMHLSITERALTQVMWERGQHPSQCVAVIMDKRSQYDSNQEVFGL